MFDMKSLREALAPIRQLGEGQIIFDCAGNQIVLRLLTPQEELDIFQYSRSVVENVPDEERDIALTTLYFDRFRSGTLAMAVVSIGDWILPVEDTVVTGEVLDNGTAVLQPFRLAFRDEMATWARPLLERMFAKYGELLEQIGARARGAIEVKEVDLDTAIEEAETRLEELRREKVEKEREGKDLRDEHISAVQAVSGGLAEEVAQIAQVDRAPEGSVMSPQTSPTITAPQAIGTVPRTPQADAPAPQRQTLVPTEAPPPMRREAPAPQPPPMEEPGRFESLGSSMVDPNGDLQEAIAAEEQRQLAIRARAQQMAQQMPQGGSPQSVPSRAPHQQAAKASQEMARGQDITPLGNIAFTNGQEGPAFEMPTQEVTGKAPQKNIKQAQINMPSSGSTNPKFRPPQR